MNYNNVLICCDNICFNLIKIPIFLEHAFDIFSVCHFQFKFASIIKPKKLNSITCSIFMLSVFRVSVCTFAFVIWNVIYFYFAMFIDNLFLLSHSFIFKSLSFAKDSKLSSCMLSLKYFKVGLCHQHK